MMKNYSVFLSKMPVDAFAYISEKLKEKGIKLVVFNVLNFGECMDSRPEKEQMVKEFNEMLEENKFIIQSDTGEQIECEVLFTYEDKKTGKNYIVYTDNTEDEEGNTKVYASIFDPEAENPVLLPIETEWFLQNEDRKLTCPRFFNPNALLKSCFEIAFERLIQLGLDFGVAKELEAPSLQCRCVFSCRRFLR